MEVSDVSLNYGDLNDARSGRIPVGAVLGSDTAGVVIEAADDGTGPAVDVRVVALTSGAYAERVAIDVGALAQTWPFSPSWPPREPSPSRLAGKDPGTASTRRPRRFAGAGSLGRRSWKSCGERYQQVLIIAFGETILSSGIEFSPYAFERERTAALIVSFIITLLLVRTYIFRAGALLPEAIAATNAPAYAGELASYAHWSWRPASSSAPWATRS